MYVRTLIIGTANRHGAKLVPTSVMFANCSTSIRKPTDRGLTDSRGWGAEPRLPYPQPQRTVTSRVRLSHHFSRTHRPPYRRPKHGKDYGVVFAGATIQTRGPCPIPLPRFMTPVMEYSLAALYLTHGHFLGCSVRRLGIIIRVQSSCIMFAVYIGVGALVTPEILPTSWEKPHHPRDGAVA